ncbi:granulocyte-macrophage colony-stimulating factor [Mastomys coucha]|uniref:granulocyte-macrophage colony-stimulating factor n=1 Tax=Mastomys coucha TaxID=35658 RepID=UPI00126289F7|nr:granulocyte-macrophage colony-stimulating factor [Mastomys coucha]
MWLQNLLFLGIVVYSFSAPTRSPITVTRPWKHVEAIKEALSLLDDTPVMGNEEVDIVSNEFSFKTLTCVQTRLKVFEKGLRGNFTKLKGALTMTANYYQTYCPPTPETNCEIQVTTFEDFIDNLKIFLTDIPFECQKPGQK